MAKPTVGTSSLVSKETFETLGSSLGPRIHPRIGLSTSGMRMSTSGMRMIYYHDVILIHPSSLGSRELPKVSKVFPDTREDVPTVCLIPLPHFPREKFKKLLFFYEK